VFCQPQPTTKKDGEERLKVGSGQRKNVIVAEDTILASSLLPQLELEFSEAEAAREVDATVAAAAGRPKQVVIPPSAPRSEAQPENSQKKQSQCQR
jgi:hypothetical protein